MVVTFMPYPDFQLSIRCLDDKRCGKQRVEAFQILQALFSNTGYSNHPATNMWRGYENALIYYYNLVVTEWVNRGKANNMQLYSHGEVVYPWWFGWDHFHLSHQASLLRKFPDYYGRIFAFHPYYYERGYIWPHKYGPMYREVTDPNVINSLFEAVNWSTIRPREMTRLDMYKVADLRTEAARRGYRNTNRMKKAELAQLLGL